MYIHDPQSKPEVCVLSERVYQGRRECHPHSWTLWEVGFSKSARSWHQCSLFSSKWPRAINNFFFNDSPLLWKIECIASPFWKFLTTPKWKVDPKLLSNMTMDKQLNKEIIWTIITCKNRMENLNTWASAVHTFF